MATTLKTIKTTAPPPSSSSKDTTNHWQHYKWAYIIGLLNLAIPYPIAHLYPLLLGLKDFPTTWASALATISGAARTIYATNASLQTLPGAVWLLAPIAWLTGHIPALAARPMPGKPPIDQPYYAVVLPYITLWCLVPLGAICAWVERLNIPTPRLILSLLAAAICFDWDILQWGHPEDILAFGAVLFAVLRVREQRYSKVGWWLAIGLSMQLIAGLAIPMILILSGNKWRSILWRAATLPAFLLASYLIVSPKATIFALTKQIVSNQILATPTIHFTTPALCYVCLKYAHGATLYHLEKIYSSGSLIRTGIEIAAIAIAALHYKRRHTMTDQQILWVLGLTYMLRLFEPVLFNYYIFPAVLFLMMAAISCPWEQWLATMALGIGLMGYLEYLSGGSPVVWTGSLLLAIMMLYTSYRVLSYPLCPDLLDKS